MWYLVKNSVREHYVLYIKTYVLPHGCLIHGGFRGVISKPVSCTVFLKYYEPNVDFFEFFGNFFNSTDVETRGHVKKLIKLDLKIA